MAASAASAGSGAAPSQVRGWGRPNLDTKQKTESGNRHIVTYRDETVGIRFLEKGLGSGSPVIKFREVSGDKSAV